MRNSSHGLRAGRSLMTAGRGSKVSSGATSIEDAAAVAVQTMLGVSMPDPGSPYQKDSGIEVDQTTIYFYADVTEKEALELNKVLRRLDIETEYMRMQFGLAERPPIHLHIHSPGGSFFSALSIVDTIKACKSPVYTYIDGFAASAATLISVVGKKRFASPHSFMLIHQQRMMWEGKHADFIDEIENQKHVTDTIQKIYVKHTKMKEKELQSILKRELHMPAEECLKLGLIDEIM